MKKPFILALITGLMLYSCSKKRTPQPQNQNTVTINGTAYNTVTIGNQTWTTVNYNGAGGENYNNNSSNVVAYGKLYTLAEAKAISLPTGWSLPTQGDYTTLLAATTAEGLMSKTGWSSAVGTNSSGFNAVPAGYYNQASFNGKGTDAIFLTSSTLTSEPGVPASFNIYQDNTGIGAVLTDMVVTATDRGSVRFVKDN